MVTPRTVATQSQWDAAESIVGTLGASPSTLGSFGVTEQDRNDLIAHLGRKSFQGSPTRNFKAAWRKDKDGDTVPNFYRVGTDALARCQYVMLTHKQYAAVIVIDDEMCAERFSVSDNIFLTQLSQPLSRQIMCRRGGVYSVGATRATLIQENPAVVLKRLTEETGGA
ncbi:hypothetical protein GP473_08980 [Corynebacterium anserum]|uniref:Uncharacterized protein n=1 Tax=Corynebacterium anserum TaxID=2684406 RepID=A0A7G7YQJ1_9CORY|nr:hypothetical protein GP473_08980 [Corynebacterium anserum]